MMNLKGHSTRKVENHYCIVLKATREFEAHPRHWEVKMMLVGLAAGFTALVNRNTFSEPEKRPLLP